MFNKKSDQDTTEYQVSEASAPSQQARPSVISEGVMLVGDLQLPGAIHLQGSLEGHIKAGQVVIGQPGKVVGEIIADTVSLAGEFNGKIQCTELSVSHTASLTGTVRCQSLKLQPGATLNGEVSVAGNGL